MLAPSPSVTTAPQAEPCGTIPLRARRVAGSEEFLLKGNRAAGPEDVSLDSVPSIHPTTLLKSV